MIFFFLCFDLSVKIKSVTIGCNFLTQAFPLSTLLPSCTPYPTTGSTTSGISLINTWNSGRDNVHPCETLQNIEKSRTVSTFLVYPIFWQLLPRSAFAYCVIHFLQLQKETTSRQSRLLPTLDSSPYCVDVIYVTFTRSECWLTLTDPTYFV